MNGKEIDEVDEFSYEITRQGAPMYEMGSPNPRSFSRGRSLPPTVTVNLSHIANRHKGLPYGNMTARYGMTSSLASSTDTMLIEIVKDGNVMSMELSNLVLTNFTPRQLEDRPNDLHWSLCFYGSLRDEVSKPDPKTGNNEQLLSMLRTFDDDALEMKL